MFKLADDVERIAANIQLYGEELSKYRDLQKRLSQTTAWYAIKRNGQWVFGPSKFVGYDDIESGQDYLNTSYERTGMTPRRI